MKYLITTTEVYRVDSESEVENLIAEAKADPNYALAKYNREYKERKMKGEVVDAWYKVTLTKRFTDEKEPDCCTTVTYGV
jgi:hypothetical protein